jgi:cysteine sulfinate desulfinase/cysteine desulfurase-like protein
MLDKQDICINTGSACSKGSSSKILDAIGVPTHLQKGSVRISLGFLNTWEDCKEAVKWIIYYSNLLRK